MLAVVLELAAVSDLAMVLDLSMVLELAVVLEQAMVVVKVIVVVMEGWASPQGPQWAWLGCLRGTASTKGEVASASSRRLNGCMMTGIR